MAAGTYGKEPQIGALGTANNRMPWQIFFDHAHLNGFADPKQVTPKVVTLDKLDNSMMNTLVQINDIYFENGGKNSFAPADQTTNENIKDKNGNTLIVRNSNYSSFAKEKIPFGTGGVIGILDKYNGTWQLYLRDINDILYFDGKEPNGGGENPDPDPNIETFFKETFGTGVYPSGSRKKIAEFTDYDMKAPIVYSDASGNADVRTITGIDAHVWFTGGKDTFLTITGINTAGKQNPKLSFAVAANLYNPTDAMDLNTVEVTCNGVKYSLPSKPVSNASGDKDKYYTFVLENIPTMENLVIEFKGVGTTNTYGIRLDNIILFTGQTPDGAIIITQ